MVDSRRPRLATSFNSELFSSHHIGVNHSLLVEEIDVGEAKLRQVVSGLAKHFSPDQLTIRHVVLITNVKPGKLRDVMSEGLEQIEKEKAQGADLSIYGTSKVVGTQAPVQLGSLRAADGKE